jgi:putative hydrolase of the HAD superfamily
MIKLISFDLDNTLWNNQSVMKRCIPTVNSWIEENVPQSTKVPSERVGQIRSELMQAHPEHAHKVSWLRLTTYQRWFAEAGLAPNESKLAAQAAFDVFWRARIEVTPFPEVKPALEKLVGRVKLAALSNGNSSLAHAGLAQYFDAALFADALPKAKPSPIGLQTAMAMFDAKPEETLHVGDSYSDDIEMAINAGAHALWLNEGDTPPPVGWHAQTVTEMFEMIEQMLAMNA